MKITEDYIKQLIKEAIDPLDPLGIGAESAKADLERAQKLAGVSSAGDFAADQERQEELQQYQRQADMVNNRISHILEKMKLRHFRIPDKYKVDLEKNLDKFGTRKKDKAHVISNNLIEAYKLLGQASKFIDNAWKRSKQ